MLYAVISIHAAREGGDETGGGFVAIELLFQSTPPVKAATPQRRVRHPCCAISIHAAREGGDFQAPHNTPRRFSISIHAAREGGDARSGQACVQGSISIHAAREGGDEILDSVR